MSLMKKASSVGTSSGTRNAFAGKPTLSPPQPTIDRNLLIYRYLPANKKSIFYLRSLRHCGEYLSRFLNSRFAIRISRFLSFSSCLPCRAKLKQSLMPEVPNPFPCPMSCVVKNEAGCLGSCSPSLDLPRIPLLPARLFMMKTFSPAQGKNFLFFH